MDPVKMISLYETLFFVSMGIAILGLALAVFFFIRFDIRTVYLLMTGKAKDETIRRMTEQNAKTGNLRYSAYGKSGSLGGAKAVSGPLSQEFSGEIKESPQVSAPEPVSETTVLGGDAAETSVLVPEDAGATAVLTREAAEPAVPNFRFEVTESTVSVNTNEKIW